MSAKLKWSDHTSPYFLIRKALRLSEKSDRVQALRDAWRKASDKEELFAALVNEAATREEEI